jgi:hypothetical protein
MRNRDNILTAGEPCRSIGIHHGLTPEQNYRRHRRRWMLLDIWLPFVPRPLRSRRPLKRYFWQAAEVEAIKARAAELSERLGW